MKRCRGCLLDKPRTDFYEKVAECKICFLAKCKERHAANPFPIRARVKAWKKNNPEKVKKNTKKYSVKHSERLKVKNLAWYYKNKNHALARKAKWRLKNKEQQAAYTARWEVENRGLANAKSARRHAAKLMAIPKWANKFFVDEIYDLASRRTKVAGFAWHVDHIVPLQSKFVCGLHVENNLRVIPAIENIKKHNRHWPNMPEVLNG